MKKFLVLIYWLISFSSSAQSLLDTTNSWNVIEGFDGGNFFTHTEHYNGDTIIGGHTYQKIMNGGLREDTPGRFYFYQFGFPVERLMYDFNLNVNDTFTSVMPCGVSADMIVDSIDSVTLLNGEKRKRMLFGADEFWIEGIGSSYGPTNVSFYLCMFDTHETLLCFTQDGNLKYHNTSYDSCSFTAVGIPDEYTSNKMIIYPNPIQTSAMFTLQNEKRENVQLKIYNSLGILVRTEESVNLNSYILYRDGLNDGLYYYELRTLNSQHISSGKFIVE
jgi:hypothetical protein